MIFKKSLPLAVFFLSAVGCTPWSSSPGEFLLQGTIFDTSYLIRIPAPDKTDALPPQLEASIQEKLRQIDRQMSLHNPQSELTRFNQLYSTDPFHISRNLWSVFQLAKAVSEETGRAFDPTLGQRGGMSTLTLKKNGIVKKGHPALHLDLNAIAKGYAVDAVSDHLKAEGYTDFLVEIGGEIAASGKNKDGKPWTIGIEKPVPGSAPKSESQTEIFLEDEAVATSGTYRQPSHILDPKTKRPIHNDMVSATVIAPRCAEADAATTALMVMGPEKGLAWIEKKKGWEAYLITKNKSGELHVHASSGWKNP